MMKRRILLELWRTLGSLEGLKYDVRFSYFLAKNKVTIKTEIEALDEIQKPNALYLDYESKRIETAQTFSDKDATGNPKVHNGQFVIYEKRTEFEKEIVKLKTKFKKPIEDREKQLKEYESFLDDDVKISLTKIRFSQLPQQIESKVLEIFINANIIQDDQDISVAK